MDNILRNLVGSETQRQNDTINLIPSENFVSPGVLEALGSPLTNKYSEGYPGKRYYGGQEFVDKIEILAQKRARKLFGLAEKDWHVNVQPYSGSPANMAVYYALLEPGDAILGLGLPFGGHLTHGWKVNFSARFYRPVHYALDSNGYINFQEIEDLARREKPKMIIAGATAYSREIDFKRFGEIAKSVGAYFLADISHIAGLVAGDAHQSPFPYADIVTTTTHKTLRGPRGAIIFANKNSAVAKEKGIDIAAAIDRAVFPALQGGPHNHQTAAIAQALEEALQPSFRRYAEAIVENAAALSKHLQELGFHIVSGGTDNHLFLVDLTSWGVGGRDAEELLESIGIIVNRNTIPYDKRSPLDPSGIRIGTPAITTRGMRVREMKEIALIIHSCINEEGSKKELRERVSGLCKKFPLLY